MSEKKIPIPGRLQNAAVGGYVAGASDILDDNLQLSQAEINVQIDAALDDRYTKQETYSKQELNSLITTPNQGYVTVEDYTSLPATGEADTIYRVASWDGSAVDATKYAEYAWNGSEYLLLDVKTMVDEVFDISVWNASSGVSATYADLASALGTNGANVPSGVRKGGMSIKFVCSSDDKYVQYRLMSDTFNTTVTNWQGVDDDPTTGSDNLVKSGGVAKIIGNNYYSDFAISDEDNNDIVIFEDGHIRTKCFDSSKNALSEEDVAKVGTVEAGAQVNDVIQTDCDDSDLRLSDEDHNSIVVFSKGHITTKNFNSEDITNSIESLKNKEEDYKNKMKQSKYYSGNVSTLNLLHMSDIHGDTEAADYFKDFADKYASFIDDFIMTGDVAFYLYDSTSDESESAHGEIASHGYKWWTEITKMAERCLFVLGNHDCETNASNPNGKGRDWAYETYFAPFANDLGIVLPNGVDDSSSPNYHACYWYKDYATQKIRVIGLDCMNRYDGTIDENGDPVPNSWVDNARNDQELWLIDRLAETLNSESDVYGYSVVFLCHYPLDDFSGRNEEWNETNHRFTYNQKSNGGCIMNEITNSPTVFHDKRTTSYTANTRHHMHNRTTSRFTKGTFNYIGDIIQEWVDDGGKYVAWICGHTHVDYMWYPTAYPTLLNVVIDKAGYSRGSDIADREYGYTRYCANYYSIDTDLGLFKIVRIGLNSNKYLDNKEVFCYDYINKRVLNEN